MSETVVGNGRARRARRARRPLSVLSIVLGLTLFTSILTASPAEAAAPPPTLTLQTSGGIVRDDSVVSSGTAMTAAVGGLLEAGTGSRELRIDLDDATVYQAGGVTAPEGWTVEWSTDDGSSWVGAEPGTPADVTSVRASAAAVAAGAINGTSQEYSKAVTSPVPASSFSGSTGGDGWDVFFYDDYVLNIFHHQSSYVALDCHLRSSGARCPGFDPTLTSGPAYSRFNGYQAANRSGGWVDGNTGFAYAFTSQNGTNSPGVLCMDLNTAPPGNCGFTALSTDTNVTSYQNLSNAEGVGGRLFGIDTLNRKLLCYDPSSGGPCAGSPIALAGSSTAQQFFHVYPLGSKVFATSDTELYCYESADLSACAGSWPVSYASLSWAVQSMSPVAHMDATGTIDGICMWNGCLDLAGAEQTGWVNPHSITSWSASNTNSSSGTYGKFTATAGRAYLHHVLSGNTTLYCFDYATEAACAGFNTTPTTDTALYALVPDPNNPACIWYNSDPGKIGLFDAFTGASECSANPVITLLPSAFAPRFVCTTSGGIDRWTSVTLDTVAGTGTPASQTLTVRTGNGDAVPGWVDVPITIGETLSLADLAVSATGARPTFNVTFSGVTGGTLTSSDFTILYEGRGPELCVDYLVDNTGASGSPNCPVVQSVLGTVTQNVSGSVSTQTPGRSFTASGSPSECPENIVYAGAPGSVQNLAADVSTALQATLTFQPPTDDGGSPIRWYEVSTDGGTTWSTITATPDTNNLVTHVMSPLAASSYTFEVRAVNLLGDGPASGTTAEVLATAPTTTTTTTAPTTTTTAPTTSTTVESTTTSVEPITDSNGDLPDLDPGDTEVTDDGVPVDVDVEVVDDTQVEVSSSDGVVLNFSGNCDGPCPVVIGPDGNPYLVMEDTGQVRVFGEGFMPGSTVHVWVFSDHTYLGAATVDGSGAFDRSFSIGVAPGEHTIQVNGVTASGANRSANLGLQVNGGSGSGQLPNTGADLTYAYLGFALLAAGATAVGLGRVLSSHLESRRETAG